MPFFKTEAARIDAKAISLVGAAAIASSLVPLMVDIATSTRTPLTVGCGIFVGYLAYNILLRKIKYADAELSYRSIMQRYGSGQVPYLQSLVLYVAAVANVTGYIMYSWSTSYIDTAVTAAVYEFWPITWFVAMRYIDRSRHQKTDPTTVPFSTRILLILGAMALIPLVYSTQMPASASGPAGISAIGVILAVLAPILGGIGALNLLLVDRIMYGASPTMVDDWEVIQRLQEDRDSGSISKAQYGKKHALVGESIITAIQVIVRLSVLPFVLMLAIVERGSPLGLVSWEMFGGILTGLLLVGPAGIWLRRAHLISENREVISLQYLVPILSLAWLGLFREISVPQLDLLIFGTIAVVAINMLINVDPEAADEAVRSRESDEGTGYRTEDSTAASDRSAIQGRLSLKALVVSLVGFGMFVYYREDLLPGGDFSWIPGDYWAVLSLASTVFALLLAFRITRIEGLLNAENLRTFDIIRRIEQLPSVIFVEHGDGSRKDLINRVRELNHATSLDDYRTAYYRCRRAIALLEGSQTALHEDSQGANSMAIADVSRDIDALAHGRQHGREFAERLALWLIGITIVMVSLALPIQPSGWAQMLSEFFVIVLSSVVVFLLFHLADLRRSRSDELLMEKKDLDSESPEWQELPEGLFVRFRNRRSLRWQRAFAGLIVFGSVAALLGILAWSRVGIF